MRHVKTVGLEESRWTPADILERGGKFFWWSHDNEEPMIQGPFATEEEAEDDYNWSTE